MELRRRNYSRSTVTAYAGWIRRYIIHQHLRHPKDLGPGEVVDFLSHLAVHDRVSPSTQNQALNALIFLYREVLQVPLFIKLPGQRRAGERIARPAALFDVYPTVSAILGLPGPELPGAPLLSPTERLEDRAIYSETFFF